MKKKKKFDFNLQLFRYVFGGYDGKNYLGSLYEYDFILKKWSLLLKDVKNLTERAFHTSVVYKDKMFIFGGYNLVNFFFFCFNFE